MQGCLPGQPFFVYDILFHLKHFLMNKIRILLADDHTILRDGIKALLGNEPDMDCIGEAEDGRTAVRLACQLKPDVVLMDIAMPMLNGLEATRQIDSDCQPVKVFILSMF